MGSYKEIEISRSDAKNYSNVSYQGDKVTAKVYIGDDGKISEDSWSNEKRESMKTEKKEDSSKKKQISSPKKEAWYNTYCGKFLFTIILVLPIWWLIKCPFVVGWGVLKSIGYIISWPFRLLMCCCCNTALVPEGTVKWPKYAF